MRNFEKLVTQLTEARFNPADYDIDEDTFDMSTIVGNQIESERAEKYQDTQLPIFTLKKVELAILEAYDSHKPLMIYGESGIGKSKVVHGVVKNYLAPDTGRNYVNWDKISVDKKIEMWQDAEQLEDTYMFIDTRVAGFEPVDIRGMELPQSKLPHMLPRAPLWVWYMSRPESGGMLFLDEINQAEEQVFNSMFSVILDKKAAELTFSNNWTIVAAGNLGTQHESVRPLPLALTQRFDTVYMVPSLPVWLKWAKSINPDTNIPRIHKHVITYAQSQPAATFFYEVAAATTASLPSPRNLEFFSDQYRKIIYYYHHKDLPEANEWITGNFYDDVVRSASKTLGGDWANGFLQFLKVYNKLDWDDMAENPSKYKLDNMDDSFAYVQFVADKMVRELSPKTVQNRIETAYQDYKSTGGEINMELWQKDYDLVKQFAVIAMDLIYKVEWTGSDDDLTQGQEELADAVEKQFEGEGELLAVLLTTIRASAHDVLQDIGCVLGVFADTDKTFHKLAVLFDDALDIADGLESTQASKI